MINLHDPEFPPLKIAIMLKAPNHLGTQPPQSKTAHVYQTRTRQIMLRDQPYDLLENASPLGTRHENSMPRGDQSFEQNQNVAFLPSSKPH